MYRVEKLNDEAVREVPLPSSQKKDTRPFKGADLYPILYSNIFMCAKKKSGKTSTIFHSLKKCCGPNTKIIAFCSTLNRDPSWETIREWAEKKNLVFMGFTGIFDEEDGSDRLKELVTDLQKREDKKEEEEEEPEENPVVKGYSEPAKEKKRKKKLPKYQSPEFIFILDDLSDELKSPSVIKLLKNHRHFRCKTIISTQYPNDLPPGGRMQMDYFILFKDHPKHKIAEIHQNAGVSADVDELWKIYKFATQEPYSFLYIDRAENGFRKNFNTKILA